jgi:hypothetical protein
LLPEASSVRTQNAVEREQTGAADAGGRLLLQMRTHRYPAPTPPHHFHDVDGTAIGAILASDHASAMLPRPIGRGWTRRTRSSPPYRAATCSPGCTWRSGWGWSWRATSRDHERDCAQRVWVSEVVLRPRATFAANCEVTRTAIARVVEFAHKHCFIARSRTTLGTSGVGGAEQRCRPGPSDAWVNGPDAVNR